MCHPYIVFLFWVAAAVLSVTLCYIHAATIKQEIQFKAILEHMERDVLAVQDEFERVYQLRCELFTLGECGYRNYNDCNLTYPNEECDD